MVKPYGQTNANLNLVSGEATTTLVLGEMVKLGTGGDAGKAKRIAAGDEIDGIVLKDETAIGKYVTVYSGEDANPVVIADIEPGQETALGEPGAPLYPATSKTVQGATGATTGHVACGIYRGLLGTSQVLMTLVTRFNRRNPADAA